MFCTSTTMCTATQRAKSAEKVHKPPIGLKKAKHEVKQKDYSVSKSFLIFYTCFTLFTLELTILADVRKTRLLYLVILLKS